MKEGMYEETGWSLRILISQKKRDMEKRKLLPKFLLSVYFLYEGPTLQHVVHIAVAFYGWILVHTTNSSLCAL